MTSKADTWKVGSGAFVILLIVVPLWREFSEPGQASWNGLLAAMLIGFVVAAVFMQRYFAAHLGEIGEARFDTSNRQNDDD